MQEERQRNAPAALARNAPVGPASDHCAQTVLAIFGVESGLLDRGERGFTQSSRSLVLGENAFAFVHAHKPLGRSAVDHWRFMAPAMRVAVSDGLAVEQMPGCA